MPNPTDVSSERLSLAHKQARDLMKRCDELIERVEQELSKFVRRLDRRRTCVAAVAGCRAGRFSLVTLTKPPPGCPSAANSN